MNDCTLEGLAVAGATIRSHLPHRTRIPRHHRIDGQQSQVLNRSDLYYRLHVFPLNVPQLRERREDIPLLIRYFTQKHAKRMNRPIEEIPSVSIEALTRSDWPGNIRESPKRPLVR